MSDEEVGKPLGTVGLDEGLADLPADAKLRCPLDRVILEVLPVTYSKIVAVVSEDRPMYGIVRAVGAGHNPIKYPGATGRHNRTHRSFSKHFRPTDLKVGEVINLGTGAYRFPTFRWGDKLCVSCMERDIAAVHPITEEQARAEAAALP